MAIRRLESISALVKAGQIREGMTRIELRALLGEPDDVGCTSRKYKIPAIWKYEDVKFAFPPASSAREAKSGGLWLVYVDSFEGGSPSIHSATRPGFHQVSNSSW